MSDPNDLDARARNLRISVRDLAGETGLDEHTVGRALGRASRGRDVLTSTYRKVVDAIERRERAQLDRLRRLHPEANEAAE